MHQCPQGTEEEEEAVGGRRTSALEPGHGQQQVPSTAHSLSSSLERASQPRAHFCCLSPQVLPFLT